MMESKNNPRPVRRIAVLSLSALGDFLLGMPLIQELRRLYPAAEIVLVCERAATRRFAEEAKVTDRIVMLAHGARRNPIAFLRSALALRRLHADMVFQTFASHGACGNLFVAATGASVRCGFAGAKFSGLLTHRVPVMDERHYITMNLDLARSLGHAEVKEPCGRYLPEMESRFTKSSASCRREVVISMGSDPALFFKRWPARQWTDLSRELSALGLHLCFVGDHAERSAIDEILADSQVSGSNLAGETGFGDLAALIQTSALVIGTDGMILHLAAAMDKTCVGLFGPTNAACCGPWRQEQNVVRLQMPCGPCYRATTIGRPMHCQTFECMRDLPVRKVYEAVVRHLELPLRKTLSEKLEPCPA
jgi:ADP-heptose:LPS heptosyltransferase